MEVTETVGLLKEFGVTLVIVAIFLYFTFTFLKKFTEIAFKGIGEIGESQSNIKYDINNIKNNLDKLEKNQDKITEVLSLMQKGIDANQELFNVIMNTNNRIIENNTSAMNQNKEAICILSVKIDNDIKELERLREYVKHQAIANKKD